MGDRKAVWTVGMRVSRERHSGHSNNDNDKIYIKPAILALHPILSRKATPCLTILYRYEKSVNNTKTNQPPRLETKSASNLRKIIKTITTTDPFNIWQTHSLNHSLHYDMSNITKKKKKAKTLI